MIRANGFAVIFYLLFFLHSPAVAVENSCKDLQTQFELSQCALTELDKANTSLNVVYKKLMLKLTPKEKSQLRNAERAWITYRDNMCDFVGLGVEGGSMQGMIISLCQTEIVKEHIAKLSVQLNCPDNDKGAGEICLHF
jgi:uncharacterized protein YecT (DUF1311 family)